MKSQINNLKKSLRGHYQAVADRAGVSKATVSMVLNAKYVNEKVLLAAAEVRNELKQKSAQLKERIGK